MRDDYPLVFPFLIKTNECGAPCCCYEMSCQLTCDLSRQGGVEFASHSDMKNALDKLDGTDLNGRKLKLSEDRKSR